MAKTASGSTKSTAVEVSPLKATTRKFRVSFPNIFKPYTNKKSGKQEYFLIALFDSEEDLTELKKAEKAAKVEKWGADPKKWPKPYRSPFRKMIDFAATDENDQIVTDENGDPVLPPGYTKDGYFVRFKTYQAPGVVGPNAKRLTDPTKVYAGCYGIAKVTAFPYSQDGNSGVSFWLDMVQKQYEGEPLISRANPEEAFEPIKGFADSETETIVDEAASETEEINPLG